MWQRFTERARKVVFYAQEEAQKFSEGYVSTEHLLLGLVRESDSVSSRVLEMLGVSVNRIRVEVERQLRRGDKQPSQDMTLTPRAKRVIDLAYDEARNLNNNYIGTEHILLGLIRESDGVAGRVLGMLGLELENARRAVMALQDKESQEKTGEPVARSTWRPVTDPTPTPAGMSQALTPSVLAVLQLAFEEAVMLGADHVDEEHLLLALLREGRSSAKVLGEYGVQLQPLRDRIKEASEAKDAEAEPTSEAEGPEEPPHPPAL